ncbi:hypothetical protein D9758_000029 [Tetrapyrgos nigripes]|uniref:Uncharacterized protein n=1 Tax=Tetrapyrgos nigripes TaxID=182062 RepID=A0A8H5H1E9_9AGAR|nr:hypothetical protein D9758_000029 [Tetrapyrgos nigripes]
MTDSGAVADNGPQVIRVTQGGKIKAWVSFSLESLQNSESRPLVYHTLPATIKLDPNTGSLISGETHHDKNKQKANAHNPMSTTPRLISVVEIIKREYLKSLVQKRSPRRIGLHQYNEIGLLDDLQLRDDVNCRGGRGDQQEGNDIGSSEKDMEQERLRQESIALALEGKNFPKQKQAPYMKITLSVSELPELVKRGATYQPPQVRRISKSAKARARKSRKKQQHDERALAGD